MVRKRIVWTSDADFKFGQILNYLENEWGYKSAKEFAEKVESFLSNLALFPELGSIEVEELGIRGFVLHEKVKLFYRIENDAIILLTFFSTSQKTGLKK